MLKNLRFQDSNLWITLSVIFFVIFNVLNYTVACNSTRIFFITGLFSAIGFISFIIAIYRIYIEFKSDKTKQWKLIIPFILIFLLTLADHYSKRCSL